MRRPLLVLIASLLSLALATPALAAKPSKEVRSLDDPGLEAIYSAALTVACGVPVQADFEGTVTVHVFTDRHGDFKREIDKYWIRDTFTNTETGATVLLRDVGPDIYWVGRDGHTYIALTGRSLTGSGVIGRTVFNLDTGELVSQSGNVVGSIVDQVCPLLV
jgi:ABC-type glycerol-3-phosphate transport system substrate-binding protein